MAAILSSEFYALYSHSLHQDIPACRLSAASPDFLVLNLRYQASKQHYACTLRTSLARRICEPRPNLVNFFASTGSVQLGGEENESTFCNSICAGPFSSSAGILAAPRRAREESPSRQPRTHSRVPSIAPRTARQAGTRTSGEWPCKYHSSRQQ